MSSIPRSLDRPCATSGPAPTPAGGAAAARALGAAKSPGRLLVVALLLTGPGCISYTLDRLPVVQELPSPSAPDLRPSVTWTMTTVGGSAQTPGTGTVGGPTEELVGTLRRSGLFRSVEEAGVGDDEDEGPAADLHLEVVMTVSANEALLAAAGTLLFVIPAWRTVGFDLVVEARHVDGDWQRYRLQDESRDLFWLPFILGMSFAPFGESYPEVRVNMIRTVLVRLAEDGLLRQGAGGESASG